MPKMNFVKKKRKYIGVRRVLSGPEEGVTFAAKRHFCDGFKFRYDNEKRNLKTEKIAALYADLLILGLWKRHDHEVTYKSLNFGVADVMELRKLIENETKKSNPEKAKKRVETQYGSGEVLNGDETRMEIQLPFGKLFMPLAQLVSEKCEDFEESEQASPKLEKLQVCAGIGPLETPPAKTDEKCNAPEQTTPEKMAEIPIAQHFAAKSEDRRITENKREEEPFTTIAENGEP